MRLPAILAVVFACLFAGQVDAQCANGRCAPSGGPIRSAISAVVRPQVQYAAPVYQSECGPSSFVVGGRDKDGYVITSISQPSSKPLAAPGPVSLNALAAIGDAEIVAGFDRFDAASATGFRKAYLTSIKKAQDAGQLTAGQAFRLRLASLSPSFCKYAEQVATIELVTSGELSVEKVNAIDWDSLADFIIKILPVILEFLKQLGVF